MAFLRGDSREKRERKLNRLTSEDDTLQAAIDGKAPLVHTHPITSIVQLPDRLETGEALSFFLQS